MSFIAFCKRNYAFLRLAVASNLEYRVNFLTDTFLQPILTALIEIVLWLAIFSSSGITQMGGFTKEYYMGYYIWAAFITRITQNWMYEYRMIEEIASGTVNALMLRPTSFFEYYFSQYMGYKLLIIFSSLLVPFVASYILDYPVSFFRTMIALSLILYYLLFSYLISFIIATMAFHLTRVHSFTMAKNLTLFLFTGELIPLDLIVEPFRSFFLHLPFAAAVYLPVSYITGRIDLATFSHGFYTVTIGNLILAPIAYVFWIKGKAAYVGTGA